MKNGHRMAAAMIGTRKGYEEEGMDRPESDNQGFDAHARERKRLSKWRLLKNSREKSEATPLGIASLTSRQQLRLAGFELPNKILGARKRSLQLGN